MDYSPEGSPIPSPAGSLEEYYSYDSEIGYVFPLSGEGNFEWRIANFFKLSEEPGVWYRSPAFAVGDTDWNLDIWPCGDIAWDSVGWVDIYLSRRGGEQTPKTLNFTIGVKTVEGKVKIICKEENYTFFEGDWGCGRPRCLERVVLLKQKSVFVPSDILTITCNLKPQHSIQGVNVLVRNLKELFLGGQYSDVVMKVAGKEFRAHRSILGSRSPVFASMFRRGVTEENVTLSISDCSADVFKAFLLYLYTGEEDDWSPDTVLDLYDVANKYGVQDLKKFCLKIVKNSLSVDDICKVLGFCVRHSESELLVQATRFFCYNELEIVETDEWRRYLQENPIHANELLVKAMEDESEEEL